MTDVFNEVEEQLRAERYESLFKRAWPWVTAVLLAALVVALGVWGWDAYSRAQEGKASLAYAHALDDQGAGKTAEAEAGYQTVMKSGPSTYKALAMMQLAGLRQGAHRDAEAVALLDKAEATAHDRLLKDAAALKAGLLLVDTAPLAEVQRRLEPLTAAGRPYREMAREGLGVARMAAGRTQEARGDFAVLAFSPASSDAQRARARAALAIIDAGTGGSVSAAAKAAAALPPQTIVPVPPGALTATPAEAAQAAAAQAGEQGAAPPAQ